jgi:ABC-type uncharacterized transport system substrate-binding protein
VPRQLAPVTLAIILTFCVLTAPIPGVAQAPPKAARIGYLATGSLGAPEFRQALDAFRQGLRERGYVEGENFVLELRSADGEIDRLPALARKLVSLKVDLIVALATPGARAAHNATKIIPIVALAMGDPIRDGLVASLARPGGNLTGSTFLGPALVPKQLELLREALPRVSRVAALWHPGAFSEQTMDEMLKATEAASRRFGLQLQLVGVRGPDEIDAAFATMVRERAEAVITFPSTMLFSQRRRLVSLAAKHRLPTVFNGREFVDLGGLVAYGAPISDLQRRAGIYAAEILKGAKPADLPVEQPTTFDLSINVKTAKALGLTIPPLLLLRANHVVE